MEIDEYQAAAADTIQFDIGNEQAKLITLLGLSGEVGELSTEYKKQVRDGDSYKIFKEKLTEEIGDVLWYLSSLATMEDILLSDVVKENLRKTQERWHDLHPRGLLLFEKDFLDDDCGEDEQFPRSFVAEFQERKTDIGTVYVDVTVNGKKFGNNVTDNAYDDDYYRYHDIFHLSYVVVLGWSPVCRKFFNCKRRSNPARDEVEDGGRGAVIDEAISILVFEYAQEHSYFDGAGGVDYSLLRAVKNLTKNLEVKACTPRDWEQAILLGFEMWRMLCEYRGGRVVCDMTERTMYFENL
jgi:NTP pyrophosphatase (non-canonical NTP hydrolase)